MTISLASQPISAAIWPRAASTAASAVQPNTWLRLAALPKCSVKYGSIASSTRGSTGVVEWLSMKMGSFTDGGGAELDLGEAHARGAGTGLVEHLRRHVDADHVPLLADAARGEEGVDAGAGAQIEHRLTGLGREEADRRTAAQAEVGLVGERCEVGGVVAQLLRHFRLAAGTDAAAAAGDLAGGDAAVAVAHLIDLLFVLRGRHGHGIFFPFRAPESATSGLSGGQQEPAWQQFS